MENKSSLKEHNNLAEKRIALMAYQTKERETAEDLEESKTFLQFL